MSRIFSAIVQKTIAVGLTDTQCGFKVFEGEAARLLFAQSRIDGFAHDVEILSLARRAGYECVALPVFMRHEGGPSSVRLAHDVLPMLLDLWRIRSDNGSKKNPPGAKGN